MNDKQTPLSQESYLDAERDEIHRKLLSLEVVGLRGLAFVQAQRALRTDVTATSNPGNEPSTAFESSALETYRDTDVTPGRSPEQDAEDPSLNWPGTREHLDEMPTDEFAAVMEDTHKGHREQIGLNNAGQAPEGKDEERLSNLYGGPQYRIDRLAHDFLVAETNLLLPGVDVVGEESGGVFWHRLSLLDEGDWVVITDPVDGSVPFKVSDLNWCMVLLLCQERRGRLVVVGGLLVLPHMVLIRFNLTDGTVTKTTLVPKIVIGDGGQWDATLEPITIELSDPFRQVPQSDPWTVAAVALSPNQRDAIAALFATRGRFGLPPMPRSSGKSTANPGLRMNPFAGNPALANMASGYCRYVIQSDWTTVFDATGILPLALQKNRFEYYRLDLLDEAGMQKRVFEDEVIGYFHDIHRPLKDGGKKQGPGTYRPIPPMFICAASTGVNTDLVISYEDCPRLFEGERVAHRLMRTIMRMRKHQHELVAQPMRYGQ